MMEPKRLIEEHVQSATICMVTIDVMQWSLKAETLSRQWMDASGCIWFCFFESESGFDGFVDGHMEVFYSNVSRSKFMSLVGFASEIELHDIHDETHPAFPSSKLMGIHIPFKLVKFIPESAFYWDDKKEDMVSLRLRSPHDSKFQFGQDLLPHIRSVGNLN